MKRLGMLIPPSTSEARPGPGLLTRRQRECAYRDGRLAAKKDLAKREDKRLSPIEIVNWCIGRCRELGLTSAATRLLELIARLMKQSYALHGHSLAQLGRMLDWTRQRASAVYKTLEATGVVVRVGKSFYFRPRVLETVPVMDRRRTRAKGESVNSPLRRRDKQNSTARTEAPKPSTRFTEEAQRKAWQDVRSHPEGHPRFEQAAQVIMQMNPGMTRPDLAAFLT